MDWRSQHSVWVNQIQKLKQQMQSLTNTDPKNLIQHFFIQALEHEFSNELESQKTIIKNIMSYAVEHCDHIEGTIREKSAKILKECLTNDSLLEHINLTDIRNFIVFEVFKQCRITLDTYFERYSSPPGSEQQNILYNKIAHGQAKASASNTKRLNNIIVYMQLLKRFFIIHDFLIDNTIQLKNHNVNWLGAMWAHHIEETSLGDLIWSLYLDIWHYEY